MLDAPFTPRQTFDDADAALAHVAALYQSQIHHLRQHLQAYVTGQLPPGSGHGCTTMSNRPDSFVW